MSTAKTNVYGKNQCLRQKQMSTAKINVYGKTSSLQVHMLSRVILPHNCVMKKLPCFVSVCASHKVFVPAHYYRN